MSLYYGGRILTMVGETEETVKYVEAVVERDGKIAFAGSLADAKNKFLGLTEVNLQGRTMMPGHIDPHLHPSMASLILQMDFITPFDWDLPSGFYPGVRTEEGYRDRLSTLIAQRVMRKTFLITWGYHPLFHGEMSRAVIDDLSTSLPVVVWHRSFHETYLGTKALQELEYQNLEDLKNHPQVDWDNGHFYEMGLDALLNTTSFKKQVFSLMGAGYKDLIKVIHKNGITTVADLEFPLLDLDLEKDMTTDNLKSEDVFFSTYCVGSARNFARLADDDHEKGKQILQDFAREFSDDQVIVYDDHVKGLLDGAFFSLLMQMEEGYPDEHSGQWITKPKEMAKIMEVYWNSKPGFQIHVHTNGDLGMRKLLEIVEELKNEHHREDSGVVVEHAGYFTKEQADKIAELGMKVSAAPYYLHTLAEKYSSNKDGIGEKRAQAINPLRWLFDNGVVTALHSDLTMAPCQPLLLAWCAVNRVTAEHHYTMRDDLAITPYQGMLAITKNAAIILGTDDIMGTIEVGKLANFTILEKDPLEVDPMEIKDIKIYAAVYKGKKRRIY